MENNSAQARLETDLRASAEARYGVERARALDAAIRVLAETLALVERVELNLDDAEPDFIR